MTTTLNFSTGSFDQENTFKVAFQGRRGERTIRATLHKDYLKDGDGILWAMQKNACLKSHYTAADYAETARLNASQPLRTGDIVEIEGKPYKVRVNGDFSDCAMFDPV